MGHSVGKLAHGSSSKVAAVVVVLASKVHRGHPVREVQAVYQGNRAIPDHRDRRAIRARMGRKVRPVPMARQVQPVRRDHKA
ncbi:hypothetical protein BLJAPNOD_02992 [Ensifer sp. M14]|nr:hypothetical protein BLJAPNOD_02992 [Ensifer sp. M14]